MCGRYEGDWVDGKYDGYGVETWARGSLYRCQYRQGLRHGFGVYRFYTRDVYAGEWANGQSRGCGVHTCDDGSRYVGEFKWGVKHGLGHYHFSGNASVLTIVLKLIDKFDFYGQVAFPKHHKQNDVPDIYRLAAKTKGVFINPALVEPFGRTLNEAAAHGLPMVATFTQTVYTNCAKIQCWLQHMDFQCWLRC